MFKTLVALMMCKRLALSDITVKPIVIYSAVVWASKVSLEPVDCYNQIAKIIILL